jgi:DNA polymerase III alpha subunit
MHALRERFLAGATANGVPTTISAAVVQHIAGFAGYGFCRSHATALARLAYETTYLKMNYPAAFYYPLSL